MSNPKLQAAHDLRKLSVMLKGILAVGDDLERIGSLEQAETEIRSRVTMLAEQETALKASVAGVTAGLSTVRAEADRLLSAARADSEALRAKAQGQADTLIAEAQRAAREVMAAAKTTRDEVVAEIGRKRAELIALDREIATRQRALTGIRDEITAVKARLG